MTGTMLLMVCRAYQSSPQNRRDESYLLHHSKTVRIVTMEDIGAHKCEHRHYIMQYRLRGQTSQTGHKEQSLMERLRVIGDCRDR